MEVLLFPLALLWYGSGLWGMVLLWRKRRLGWFSSLGCTTWILFGWIGALVVLCIPLALGPIVLWIGRRADDRSARGRSVAPSAAPMYTPRRPN